MSVEKKDTDDFLFFELQNGQESAFDYIFRKYYEGLCLQANATPVAAGNVDIDHILDERLRGLYFEEYRTVTLMRTKKLAERVRKYNPMYNGTYVTNGVEEYHNLYLIPTDEIGNNSEAVLAQNPGYN